MITLKVRLDDAEFDIRADVLKAVRKVLDRSLKFAAEPIRFRIRELCRALIEHTDEYHSLLSGQLLGELGIPDVQARLHEIVAAIQRGVGVHAEPVSIAGDKLHGGLTINMLSADFEDILELPAATYLSNAVHEIPWLRWLLTTGDRIMVYGYDVTFRLSETARAKSRTGMAIMIPHPGGGWRVPPRFSGTIDDNFLLRAFNGAEVAGLIGEIMREEIQRRLDA